MTFDPIEPDFGLVIRNFIELDYDKVKEMFYQEDKKFWDEEINL